MSYTRVRAMRSNRYPLMGKGLGCGCAMHGLGDLSTEQMREALRRNLMPSNDGSVPPDIAPMVVDDGMSTAAIVGIASVGVVAAGGLGWWLLRRRRAAA